MPNNKCPNCNAMLISIGKECPKCHYNFNLGRVPQDVIDRIGNHEYEKSAQEERDEAKQKYFQENFDVVRECNYTRDFYNILLSFKFTTGFSFEGYKIEKYLGIKTGSSVLGTGALSEVSSSVSDILGTKSSKMENKISIASEEALHDLMKQCYISGANAAIGVDIKIMTIGNNMIVTYATGTAVIIEKMQT